MQSPSLTINVNGVLHCTNDTTVTINKRFITLTRVGPRGGSGAEIEIPIAEWNLIAESVEAIRAAFATAEELVRPIQLPLPIREG